jgi:hypothetical protein
VTDANPFVGMDPNAAPDPAAPYTPAKPKANPFVGMRAPWDDVATITAAKARQAPVNPDQYAEASRIAPQVGVPVPVAARNLDHVRQIKQNQDMRQFAEAHAAGGLWLAQGDHAALSHDDLDAMSRISVYGGAINNRSGTGNAGDAFAQNAVASVVDFLSIVPKLAGASAGIFGTDAQDAIFRKYADPMVAYADALRHSAPSQAHPTAAKTGDVAGTLATFVAAPGAEAPKAGELAAPWIAKFVADPRVQSFLTRTAQSAVENLPRAALVSTAQGSAAATRQAQAGVPLSQQEAAYAVGVPAGTLANVAPMSIPGGRIARALSGEVVGLALSAAHQEAQHLAAPGAVGPVEAPDFTDPATYLPALLAVVFGDRGRPGASPPTHEQVDAAAAALESASTVPDRVATAAHNAEQLDQVMQAAADSKLGARSPEHLADFVKTVADHTVYLPVDKVDEHFLSQGLDPATEVDAMTGDITVYDNAQKTGTLAIPLADYAISGQDLHAALGEDAKLDPAGIAPSEIPNVLQAHEDVVKAAMPEPAPVAAPEVDHATVMRESAQTGQPAPNLGIPEAPPAVEHPAILSDSPPTVPDFLKTLREEIGWSVIRGRLLRDGTLEDSPTGPRAAGEVTGRTKWIGKIGPDGQESNFWRMRPDPISEKQAHAALDKLAAGEKLSKPEQRFIDYATKYAEDQLAEYKAQAQANPEHQTLAEQAALAELRAQQRAEADTGHAVRSAEGTSIKNAVTEAEAVRDGVAQVYSEHGPGNRARFDAAVAYAQAHPGAGRRLTETLLASPRPVSADEHVALNVDRIRIYNELAAARHEVENKAGKTPAQQAADLANVENIEGQRRDNDLAARRSGSAAADSLQVRQLFASLDYRLESILQRAENARGKKLDPEVTANAKEYADKIVELQSQLDAIHQAKAKPKGPKKSVDERVQTRVKARIVELQATIAERLKACPV